jgi:hypothetical protein
MATDLDTDSYLAERLPAALKAPRIVPWLALAALFVVAVILKTRASRERRCQLVTDRR